jgi:calcium channel MID1
MSDSSIDGNCEVIFDLPFCNEVAYAVPANPNVTNLTSFYDNNAQSLYQTFNYSLQQVPCHVTNTAQYSLVRNCSSCADAYKKWLCTVTIPRCHDYSSTHTFLQPRNMAQKFINGSSLPPDTFGMNALAMNSSRNPLIDQVVKPGPYKELLPCDFVCHNLVQSCPSYFQFGCPAPGKLGFNSSYGRRPANGSIQCNFLGAEHLGEQSILSGTSNTPIPKRAMTFVFLIICWLIW